MEISRNNKIEESVLEAVKQHKLATQIPTEQLLNMKLREDLHFDSLDSVELLLSIEKMFDFTIPEKELDNIIYVKDLLILTKNILQQK